MKTLTIISHTEHYKKGDSSIVGLVSTVEEINHLLDVFDRIIHVAPLHEEKPPENTSEYRSNRIEFIPIKPTGGRTLGSKIAVVTNAYSVLKIVKKALQKSDVFQFRAPTGIGVYTIPYLMFFAKKKGWYKYAGSWQQKDVPMTYRFQRWLLKKQKLPVTINGFWDDQPPHCKTFENPCLTQENIKRGLQVLASKDKSVKGLELCFIGRLEKAKGFDVLINVLKSLPEDKISKIKYLHVIGSSNKLDELELNQELKNRIVFHGLVSREKVHNICAKCHALILPSKSEGFPKVIVEALNYGCIPIITDISAISHYIEHDKTGFLLKKSSVENLKKELLRFIELPDEDYQDMLKNSRTIVSKFTFNHYTQKISLMTNIFFTNA